MGIFKQLLKVIKWDDDTKDTIVYRFPMDDRKEIMNGCQLIVAESQVAILASQGQIADVYGPGVHKLTTGNMPILTTLASWKYGFDSPFKADVYYVNTKQFTNMKWGTTSKITMRDAEFGLVRIGARGTYSFKVKDASAFMKEIFGTNKEYTTSSLVEYFKSMVVTNFTKVVGLTKISVIDLPASYMDLSDDLKTELTDDFDKIGLEVCAVYVEAIVLPEEVEAYIDKRSSVGIMNDSIGAYSQLQAAEAMREAANNPGGGMAATGVGIAAGMAMFNNMNQNMQANQQQANAQQQAPQSAPQAAPQGGATCPHCGASVSAGAKFCSNCGKEIPQKKFCTNCGAPLAADAKFCSECGSKQ